MTRRALGVLALALCGCSSSSSSSGREVVAPSPEPTPAMPTGSPALPDAAAESDAPVGDATVSDALADAFADGVAPFDASDAGEGDARDATDAGSDASIACANGDAGEPLELRCTGLYRDWDTLAVDAPAVRTYDPGLHLWSDGADKTRWVYLPPGQAIDTTNVDEWTFPVGTKFWKEFVLAGKRIETRLLWKQSAASWYRTTYRWSADGVSSATELTGGQLDADGHGYEVPTQAACNYCHQGRLDDVLGFDAVGLSSAGASGVTLGDLVSGGLLTAPPAAPITIPGTPAEVAALGYLHANCGTACHNGGNGVAGYTGFRMRLDVATLASVQTTDAVTTGLNVRTQGYTLPGVATTYRFKACDAASSASLYRMSHRDGMPGVPDKTQMPPIDSHEVDDAGLAAITTWIDEGCAPAGP